MSGTVSQVCSCFQAGIAINQSRELVPSLAGAPSFYIQLTALALGPGPATGQPPSPAPESPLASLPLHARWALASLLNKHDDNDALTAFFTETLGRLGAYLLGRCTIPCQFSSSL